MLDRLTDQHPVKRITVNRGKRSKPLNTGFIQGQVGNLVSFALGGQISFLAVLATGACRVGT